MFEASGRSSGVASQALLSAKTVARDDESQLAASLRSTRNVADRKGALRPESASTEKSVAELNESEQQVAAEMVRAIGARLPGRVRDLKICVEREQFILRGVSSSYYVKQVAGHLAMNALEARLLARLVNEIEVRSVR